MLLYALYCSSASNQEASPMPDSVMKFSLKGKNFESGKARVTEYCAGVGCSVLYILTRPQFKERFKDMHTRAWGTDAINLDAVPSATSA